MKIEKKYLAKIVILLFSTLLFFGAAKEIGDKNKSQRLGKVSEINPLGVDSYYMSVNKIDLPIDHKGVIADVVIGDNLATGRMDGKTFLYSSGFYLSGINDQFEMWTNGVATASRVEDYEGGNAMVDPDDSEAIISDDTYSGLFVVNVNDEPFGETWVAWGEAVKGGAKFYDGDGDGLYNPVDINGNGEWDPDEDSPDILGTETAWCVYTDSKPSNFREFTDMSSQGIDIRQTVWAYATDNDLGNIIFVRYSLLNTGLVSEVHDSVYFGVWADPDLGDPYDDMVGSDTTLNAGFLYNQGADDIWGSDPPCFLIDFFQGPWEESVDPSDFALNTQGPLLGVDTIWGANNVPMTSFVHYIQGHPSQGDPDDEFESRFYLKGFNQQGDVVDPCTWEFGVVRGEDCATIDPRYMYSGDPINLTGWIHVGPDDQRQMSNTGPFKLYKDLPVDIVVAYVAGRGNSAIASIKEAKKIDRSAQFVFQNNFIYPAPPPEIVPIVKANDREIELIWETTDQMDYSEVGVGYDMHFEWYEVKMYDSYTTSDENDGRVNSKVIARYDVQNDLMALLYENPVNSERNLVYNFGGIQLDSATYFNPETGRISLRITQDPFTSGPLQKNKPYFISVSGTAVNYDEIVKYDALGTYLVPGTAVVGYLGNIPIIIDDDYGNQGIITGEIQNEPYYFGVPAEHIEGSAESEVSYSVQDKDKTTNHSYEVGFFQDSLSVAYVLYYYIKDVDLDTLLVDSSKAYLFSTNDFDNEPFYYSDFYREQINHLVDGATVTIPWIDPGVDTTIFTGDQWFLDFNDSTTGGFYVGRDVSDPSILPITSATSSAISVGDLLPVDIRFGETSLAHRYVRRQTNRYPLGDNTGNTDSSFVEVPFAAYEILPSGEERRLAVGFTETANDLDSMKMPDGIWYPGNNILNSKEYIIVFKGSYDETLTKNLAYFSAQQGRLWADIANGYKIDTPPDYQGDIDSLKSVAKSAWFDAMYVCGFETDMPRTAFNPTGTFSLYPGVFLTDRDKYQYTVQTELVKPDAQSNWDKISVFPNPLFGYNEGVSYTGGRFDEPYVTFNNLPNDVTISLYSLSGVLVRTLEKSDPSSILRWDLENESDLRVASGMYIALISNPEFGQKVLKLAIIMPQKQIQNY